MLDYGFYNMDCLEGMKQYPNKYFDLAVVDPPYGSGLTEGGGCAGWFSKYHQDFESGGGTITGSAAGSTGTKKTHYTFGLRKSSPNYDKRKEDKTRKK